MYILNGVESLISYSHEFEAEGDENAIEICETWRKGRPAELWCGTRKVRSWVRD